jgi:hypothetical protein
MTNWYHVHCPTGSNWESPWLIPPPGHPERFGGDDDFDPTYGMTEYEFFGDVGDK